MKSRSIYTLTVLACIAWMGVVSCNDSNKLSRDPGTVYAPDMNYSRAYETYAENPVYPNDMASRKLVKGTVSRDGLGTPEYTEGDSSTIYGLSNPLTMDKSKLEEGERFYNIYCAPCHGVDLDGNGPLYASGKYPLAPANLKSDKFKAYSQGKLYYTIMYGKNMMGSYAAQLSEEQRWMITAYIKSANGSGSNVVSESTEEPETEPEAESATTENEDNN